MPSYRYTATTRAPIEVVWNVVQDHERMDLLLSPLAARAARPWLAEEGSPDRNGVGALRRFGKLPLGERIVEFEPPRRLVYTIENAPIRGYRGVVELFERFGGGTDITWSGDFDEPSGVLGAATARGVGAIVRSMLKRAVAVAERRAV